MEEPPPGRKVVIQRENGEEQKPFFTPPAYTMKEIHDAIPAHCFERNTLLSLAYVARDFLYVLTLLALATQIPHLPTSTLRSTSWVVYAFTQGLVFTGLWELAHESGHGALSTSKAVNNNIGLLIHSLLLVPYHSWRFTHSQHHKSTNNIERDIAFVPDTKDVYMAGRDARPFPTFFSYWDLVEDTPIMTLLTLIGHQLVAWPIYLTINNFALPRMRATPWWKRSHFYFGGDGPNFKPQNRDDILLSNLGIGFVVAGIWCASRCFGAWNVMLFYGFPWLWTNHWILTITYLQHTDPLLPYYPTSSWSFLRGAASTVDRDFGFINTHFFHGAISTHVLHHHACRIPFYHAQEASEAIQPIMGVHYQMDAETPYMWAFWKNYNACKWVEEVDKGSGIFFFEKKCEGQKEQSI